MNSLTDNITEYGLSVRAENALKKSGRVTLGDVLDMTESEIANTQNIGKTTIDEISAFIDKYRWVKLETLDPKQLSVNDMVRIDEYKDRLIEFVRTNDVHIEMLGLSIRSENCLHRGGFNSLSDFITITDSELASIKNMGKKSVVEIRGVIDKYLSDNEQFIKSYCLGDESSVIDESRLKNRIMGAFDRVGYEGLHYADVLESLKLPSDYDEELIKNLIGELIFDNELEYSDFRLYKNYPSFRVYVEKCDTISVSEKRIMFRRLKGVTLEELGKEEGVTRERIRQKLKKISERVRNYYVKETGFSTFDEDYYWHLYTHYKLDKNICVDWLGISISTYAYLNIAYKDEKSKNVLKELDRCFDDTNVHMATKMKVYNYVNRDKIFIDDFWIENKRATIERYVASKVAREDITFDEFTRQYNEYLVSREITDEKLLITDSVKHTRENVIGGSDFVVWKQWKTFRYYEIDRYDYTELFEALALDGYKNVYFSTLKWINDYPELMKKYDIRDQYELHNLLKKLIGNKTSEYGNIIFAKMPMIAFGNYDRDTQIRNMVFNNSPISGNDLLDKLYEEYGFEKATVVGSFLGCIAEFYHGGVYQAEYEQMDSSRFEVLKDKLCEDFYLLDEVRYIYSSIFGEENIGEVNAFNLRKMGFDVYSYYILKNYKSLFEYFCYLLTSQGIQNLNPIRKRFGYNQTYYGTLNHLRKNHELYMIDEDNIVTYEHLNKTVNLTKEDVEKFSNDVYEFLEDNEFFTIKSINYNGFCSKLYDLGFEECFYSSIIAYDDRFSYTSMFGTMLLYKGKLDLSFVNFMESILDKELSIDLIDMHSDLQRIYGCDVEKKNDIVYKLRDSSIYYDSFMDRLYRNKDLYYKEIEEGVI